MSARVHVCWMVVVLAVAVWLGWLWRFKPAGDCLIRRGESFSVEPAPAGGAFDDLIPKEGAR